MILDSHLSNEVWKRIFYAKPWDRPTTHTTYGTPQVCSFYGALPQSKTSLAKSELDKVLGGASGNRGRISTSAAKILEATRT